MSLTYTAQPVQSTNEATQRKGYTGQVGDKGDAWIVDSNNVIVAYFYTAPGLASTINARVTEMNTIVAAVVSTLNGL